MTRYALVEPPIPGHVWDWRNAWVPPCSVVLRAAVLKVAHRKAGVDWAVAVITPPAHLAGATPTRIDGQWFWVQEVEVKA